MTSDTSTGKTSIEKARHTKALARANGEPELRLTPIQKWENDKLSLRKSINAKCYDCSCHQINEIKGCTVQACPLWLVRPYQ
jgi:hypothetical protein